MKDRKPRSTEKDPLAIQSEIRSDGALNRLRENLATFKAAADNGCGMEPEALVEMEVRIDNLEQLISQNNLSR